MSATIIEIRGLSKRFGVGDAETLALRDVDLKIKAGEFVMVTGPSGCGKTTLLNIIGLLDRATYGEYYLDNHPVARISKRKQARLRNEKIGTIFQSFNLIQGMSVIENVALPLIYRGVGRTRRLKMASKMLGRFQLNEREYYMPSQLSGGQQQRVAIARSLIGNPSIILADEPTGNLDSRSSHIVMEELREIHEQGNTIIMVTHNANLTAYATRVVNIIDGKVDSDTVIAAGRAAKRSARTRRRR
jgi:putative ABC transport system ATP-binding protein